jgi:hypothetical protein
MAPRALDTLSTLATDRYADCLSASWLSARLGIDVARIDAWRRAGELVAVRPEGSTEWFYPAWQFAGGEPRPVVRRIVAAARAAQLDDRRLYAVLTAPLGLGARGDGAKRLADLIASGADDQVVAAVRSASPR